MTTAPSEPVPTTAVAPAPIPRAPEGTKPGTVWIWLLAFTPLLTLVLLIPTSAYLDQIASINPSDVKALGAAFAAPSLAILSLLDLVFYIATILFPILDWRDLEKRGVPKPFHWSWSLFVFLVGSPIVYVIGRTVVVKRRTGAGLAPLWVFIATGAVYVITGFVVFTLYAIELITTFTGYLATGAGSVL